MKEEGGRFARVGVVANGLFIHACARTLGNDPNFSGKNQIPFYCISGILRIYG